MKIYCPVFSSQYFKPALVLVGFVAVWCLSCGPVSAQSSIPAAAEQDQQKSSVSLGKQELRELLGPIAHYPDALIATILPAATVPADIVLGARYLESSGDPRAAEARAWDESVQSLIRYPQLIAWLDENLAWTVAVGEAFVAQPADVMNAIQSLKAEAPAGDPTVRIPEQTIVVEKEITQILPPQPEIIYVPLYNNQVVYARSYSVASVISFGFGSAAWGGYCRDFDRHKRNHYRGNSGGWGRVHSHHNQRGTRGCSTRTYGSSLNSAKVRSTVRSVNSNRMGTTRRNLSERRIQSFPNAIQRTARPMRIDESRRNIVRRPAAITPSRSRGLRD